jgi:hypothetical protein
MVAIEDINSAIRSSNLTNEELNTIVESLKYARAQLTRRQARALWPGDTVKFTSNRNGVTYTGTVEKVKIKFALVRTGNTRFNVPLNMLEAA